MNLRPPEIWLVSGPDRAARHALARRLATHLDASAHVDGEALWEQVVSGLARPGEGDEDESDRQYELAIRNQCLLARSYAEAGFTPVLDFPVATEYHLDAYLNYLMGARVHLAIVEPSEELAGRGLVVDPDATPEAIVERAAEALVRRI